MEEKASCDQAQMSEKRKIPGGTMIDKPNGSFAFSYSVHFFEHNPEKLPDSDGLVLESIGLEGINNHYATSPENDPLAIHREGKRGYRDVFKSLEARGGTRIFLVDIDMTLKAVAKSFGLPAIEFTAGFTLLSRAKAIKHKEDEVKLSRRSFLSKVGQATAGLYLITPELGYFSNRVAEANQIMHPELLDLLLTFRNYLFAQKLDRIARELEGCPTVTTIIGAFHKGIEDKMLVSPSERLDYFRRIKPRLEGEIAVPESLYKIAEMRYDAEQDKWYRANLLEDEVLKEIFVNG